MIDFIRKCCGIGGWRICLPAQRRLKRYGNISVKRQGNAMILDRILEAKKLELAQAKQKRPLRELEREIARMDGLRCEITFSQMR
jgi:hypothetical protein